MRNNPNSVDIADGSALNSALTELSNPKIFSKAVDYGGKIKLGGEAIRNIPFQYASAGISTSVHQLTQGGAPAALKREEFGPDRDKLKAIAAELRKEGEELGTPNPATIKKAKDQIMATKAKVEATVPPGLARSPGAPRSTSRPFMDWRRCWRRPPSTSSWPASRSGPRPPSATSWASCPPTISGSAPAETPAQRQVYNMLYPMLAGLRDQVSSVPGSAPPMSPTDVQNAPGEVFGSLDYNHAERQVPPPPAPK